MQVKFQDTILESDRRHIKLLDRSGRILLELKGQEVADAIRAGFIEESDLHYSMFEYSRMRLELACVPKGPQGGPEDRKRSEPDDNNFLKALNIRWE